ncbi:MAG: PepSY-like domain-containing protein [Myxococcales bacterium]|nr:PepSY-like domain-containing protein [Myxococcales bacterium]
MIRKVLALGLHFGIPFVILGACGGKPTAQVPAHSAGGCPPAVAAAVTKAFPDATQRGCEGEHEDGMEIYEVKLAKADGGTAEVEVSPDGTIVQVEKVIATAMLPEPVATAFAAKYPGVTATRVERVTRPAKGASFEIKFAGKEATFSETGAFVEEEAGEAGDGDGDKD